jgi:uncharacterized protein (TIGR02246 family)
MAFLFAALVMGGLFPVPAFADSLAQIERRIATANDRFGPAVQHHDANAIAAEYMLDGVLIPSKGKPIRGRAAIARYYAERMPALASFSSIRCATGKVAFDGTAVLEEGSCLLAPRKGIAFSAPFLTVWKKDADGRWRIAINE